MTGEPNSSSTELALAAFREAIVPMAGAAAPYRLNFRPEAKDASYFVQPRCASLTRESMEAMGHSGELAALDAIWRAGHCERLCDLIPRFAAIAERIAAEHGSADATQEAPSQLIYQMY